MPYIEIKTNKAVPIKSSDAIKSKIGAIINVIPEKSEEVLMLNIEDNCTMFFSGKKKECCYAVVKLHHQAPQQSKSDLVEKLFDIFGQELTLPKQDIFITVEEHQNWGANGQYLA